MTNRDQAPPAPGEEARGLRLSGVSVRYPGRATPALDGIDLEVAAGEQVGVAGRTGAGKSTLALAAAGFIPRVVRGRLTGEVIVDGVSTAGALGGDLLGRVGIVFSTPANQLSASKLTVREELAFGLENLAVPRADMDRRIDDVLERLGIAQLADREPFALSGGEQQRVAIASIVAMGTRVLVLDEPTAQLDPAGTAAVADVLAELAAGGTAVICVEHDPIVLARQDRCLVLDAGRTIALDAPGVALDGRVLEPLGLRAPTLLRLAAAAGLDARRGFDEGAVADALRAHRPGLRVIAAETGDAETGDAVRWQPVIEQPTARLEIEDLGHRYPNGVDALRGVDLRIEPGETVAIVGRNGSGKTTLAKHFDGLLRPTRGRVLLDGRDTVNDPVHVLAATIGFVFQSPDDQLFERSVEREVAFGPRTRHLPAADAGRLVDQAIAIAGLDDVRTVNPYDLDLSRRKLVGLASVLATDPTVVVLDEPTTGQDGPGVERVGGIVSALRDAGRSVIAITHDMEFAARHFARIVVMRGGEVVADGKPATIFAAANVELLASTGLTPPPAARIAARLELTGVPATAEELLAMLAAGG